MMEHGLQRGGLKRPALAQLELGIAYTLAGRKELADKAFNEVHGEDGTADLARLWRLYLKSLP
jgi:hypothetical protein